MWRTTDAVESWSWEGCEGKRTMATVYSDAPVVELLVNGQSLGKKKTKQDMAKFKKVTYQEGQIEAVAYDASGKETGRSKLVSASGKTKISLRPECQSLRANGQDLCFLNIDLVGEKRYYQIICRSGLKGGSHRCRVLAGIWLCETKYCR